jgi:hypothetical protein
MTPPGDSRFGCRRVMSWPGRYSNKWYNSRATRAGGKISRGKAGDRDAAHRFSFLSPPLLPMSSNRYTLSSEILSQLSAEFSALINPS